MTVEISGPQAPPDPADIPTVSQWGLTALALMVLTAGSLVMRRPRGFEATCNTAQNLLSALHVADQCSKD